MTFGTWLLSVLIATGAAPFGVAVVSLAQNLVTGRETLESTLKNVLIAPAGAVFMMIFFALPVIAVVGAFSGAAITSRRFLGTSTIPLWIIAALCLAYMPIALGRYPGGDGGSMRSFGEMMKATIASGVMCWSVYAAMRIWPRL